MTTSTAWDLIGDEGQFRIVGGRTVYSDVLTYDGRTVRLAYLKSVDGHLHQVNRYVDPDTQIEVIRNYSKEYEAERAHEEAELRARYG